MKILPAIDLYEGRVVRLRQGDFDRCTAYGDDPCAVAASFRDAGAREIHVVDLEGARQGAPVHLSLLAPLRALGVEVRYGGGLRTAEDGDRALAAGATRIMVGSLLFRDPLQTAALGRRFGKALVASVDVKEGRVAVGGWTATVDRPPAEALEELAAAGCDEFLVTAVSRDGTGEGPDFDLYRGLRSRCPHVALVAAGGIAHLDDLKGLHALGLAGAVVGRALYEGTVDLAEALRTFPP
ncbi:MAG TPA: 1-(5-phosphoribosyl)-5-[(5-phosphoribosylamino)methylideneamino] imidazole-4-carboxamide isomerase [Synergistaceae bacterium]|nr:1-(5-phosphoribosyl)-5-[(5-phosphoribosylamino)methylideneamino] imidazole-4-carboxamide isomerase [Synergistaceae bacterium]